MRPVVSSVEFPFYVKKAERYIRRYACGNVDESDIPECVKLCCCEVAEFLYKSIKSRPKPGVTSQTTGDVSESYSSEDYSAVLGREIKRIIYNHLADTGLLYRGVK